MYTVTYWPDWAGGELRQFKRESFKDARARLVYWLQYDPTMKVAVHKDGARLSVTALLDNREEPWS